MTMVGMLGTGLVTANASDDELYVDINDVTFNTKDSSGSYENPYYMTNPIVHIPTGRTLTYMTINVRNAYFDTSDSYVQAAGTHHYNSYGNKDVSLYYSHYGAYSDLIILNDGYKGEDAIKNILKNIKIYRSDSNYWYKDETASAGFEGIQIEVEISDNAIDIPSTYNYDYYKDITTGKTYLYLTYADTTAAGMSWHEAYNAAKTLEFSNMKGYLAADTPDGNFNTHLERTGGETSGVYAGWVGITSLYNATDSSKTYSATTWTKSTDSDVWANKPDTGEYASAESESTTKNPEYTFNYFDNDSTNKKYPSSVKTFDSKYWDSNQSNNTTNLSKTAATANLQYYYLADGPSVGTTASDLSSWMTLYHSIDLYNQSTYTYAGQTEYDYNYSSSKSYAFRHYSPDNLATTVAGTSTLTRSDNTTKEDCAAFDEGKLEDYSESVQKKAFYVEFASKNDDGTAYANAFKTGTSTTYLNGISTSLYTAAKDLTDVTSGVCTFNTYLLMDDDASVPTQDFYYTVKSVKGTADNKIFTGIDELTARGYVSWYQGDDGNYHNSVAKFTSGGTATEYSAGTGTDKAAIQAATGLSDAALTGKKYAVVQGKINFSTVEFHEPGIYRFQIKEDTGNERYIQYDSVGSMYVDVYVDSVDGSETLQVVNYIMHTGENDTVWSEGTDTSSKGKRPYFVNQYLTDTLTVTKNVSGNQARLDQAFDFTLNLYTTANGAKITAQFTDTTTTSTGGVNSSLSSTGITTSVSSGVAANGGSSEDNIFHLKANQSVTFNGVPKGSEYYVYEDYDQLYQLGYTATLKSANGDNNSTYDSKASDSNKLKVETVNSKTYVHDDGMTENTTLVINNDKDGLVPTGIIVTVAPYAAVALCGFFGLIVFARHKKNEDEEEN
jgi:hypothetical protein